MKREHKDVGVKDLGSTLGNLLTLRNFILESLLGSVESFECVDILCGRHFERMHQRLTQSLLTVLLFLDANKGILLRLVCL